MSKGTPAHSLRSARNRITRARMNLMAYRSHGGGSPKVVAYLQDVIDDNEARIEELMRQAEWGAQ